MPFSNDAEKGLLSCFMHNPADLLPDAATSIPAEAFYHAANRLLYEVMLEFDRMRKPVEYIALSQHLRDKVDVGGVALIEKIGGQGMLAELLDFVPTPTHYGYYKKILNDKHLLRRIIGACEETRGQCFEYQEDVMMLATQAEARMFDILSTAQSGKASAQATVPAKEAVADWLDYLQRQIDNRGKINGLSTGLADVDRTLWGIDDSEGEVTTISGRPGDGKTAAGVSITESLGCAQGVPGIIFSQEMSITQWLTRQVLGQAEIDTAKGLTAHFSREELSKKIPARVKALQASPIFYNGNPSLTTADLRTIVQVHKRKHNIRWILIDHLHLTKGVDENSTKDERARLVEVMETLHFIKKTFKVGIILLVQLSRETDRNKGKLPLLADLSGSAAIEQFSDHVIFLSRPVMQKSWKDVGEEGQAYFVKGIERVRKANPNLWADGSKYHLNKKMEELFADDGKPMRLLSDNERQGQYQQWRDRQDYEEHALWVVRKNRRGPTPEIFMRFQPEFTRFVGRTEAIFTNDEDKRQVGYTPK